MGAPKALLRYPPGAGGEPLVRRVARALREGGAASVIVVAGPDETGRAIAAAIADVPDVSLAVNPAPDRGMLSSVQTGLRALENGTPFLVCPCDLPKLTASHVAAILAASDGDEDAIVVPTFAGKRGHPTLFGGALAAEVLALDPQKYGLNALLGRHADHVREIVVADDAVVRDADTPEEWRALGGAETGHERDG